MFLLRRLLGVKSEDKKQTKVAKLAKNELLLINIGSTSTGGRVLSVKADLAKIQLTTPACTEIGEKVALSRRIEKHWRLVGAYPCGLPRLSPCAYALSQDGARCSVAQYSSSTKLSIFHCTHTRIPLMFCDAFDNRVAIEACIDAHSLSFLICTTHYICNNDKMQL